MKYWYAGWLGLQAIEISGSDAGWRQTPKALESEPVFCKIYINCTEVKMAVDRDKVGVMVEAETEVC